VFQTSQTHAEVTPSHKLIICGDRAVTLTKFDNDSDWGWRG